jgi:hypothetical protein
LQLNWRQDQQKDHQKHHVKKRTSFPIPTRPKGGGGIGDKTLETLCKADAKELDKKKEKEDPKGEIRSSILEKTFGLMRKKALARR